MDPLVLTVSAPVRPSAFPRSVAPLRRLRFGDPHDGATRPSVLLFLNAPATSSIDPHARLPQAGHAREARPPRCRHLRPQLSCSTTSRPRRASRPFNLKQRALIPICSTARTQDAASSIGLHFRRRPDGGLASRLELKTIDGPFDLFRLTFTPIPGGSRLVALSRLRFPKRPA